MGCKRPPCFEGLLQVKELSREWRAVGCKRPQCFEGLLQNINAVLAIHVDLVVGGPLTFLKTGRINQDFVENFLYRELLLADSC